MRKDYVNALHKNIQDRNDQHNEDTPSAFVEAQHCLEEAFEHYDRFDTRLRDAERHGNEQLARDAKNFFVRGLGTVLSKHK